MSDHKCPLWAGLQAGAKWVQEARGLGQGCLHRPLPSRQRKLLPWVPANFSQHTSTSDPPQSPQAEGRKCPKNAPSPRMPARKAAVVMSLAGPGPSCSFPLFNPSWSWSSPVPPLTGTAVKPCQEHRPLPPIDRVAGLSWLDHVESFSEPCFERVNLGWEEIGDADVTKLVRLVEAGVHTFLLYQNQIGTQP